MTKSIVSDSKVLPIASHTTAARWKYISSYVGHLLTALEVFYHPFPAGAMTFCLFKCHFWRKKLSYFVQNTWEKRASEQIFLPIVFYWVHTKSSFMEPWSEIWYSIETGHSSGGILYGCFKMNSKVDLSKTSPIAKVPQMSFSHLSMKY